MEQVIKLPNDIEARITEFTANNGNPYEAPVYRLTWGNGFLGVYDENTEYYQNLSLALMRVATLNFAVTTDLGFANEPLRFSSNAIQFLTKEVN